MHVTAFKLSYVEIRSGYRPESEGIVGRGELAGTGSQVDCKPRTVRFQAQVAAVAKCTALCGIRQVACLQLCADVCKVAATAFRM